MAFQLQRRARTVPMTPAASRPRGSAIGAKPKSAQAFVPFWQRPWLLGALLMVVTLWAYWPATRCGFIWDDDRYVTENELLRAPDGLWRIWFSLDAPSQYFPLVYTTFRFEYGLWGVHPTGYHWVNIFLHAGNGILAWRLLGRLGVSGAWF